MTAAFLQKWSCLLLSTAVLTCARSYCRPPCISEVRFRIWIYLPNIKFIFYYSQNRLSKEDEGTVVPKHRQALSCEQIGRDKREGRWREDSGQKLVWRPPLEHSFDLVYVQTKYNYYYFWYVDADAPGQWSTQNVLEGKKFTWRERKVAGSNLWSHSLKRHCFPAGLLLTLQIYLFIQNSI